MNIRHALHNITFEWDRQKAAANAGKREISFALAGEAFFDPFVSYLDEELVNGELRETIIGMTEDWRLLNVVYDFRGDLVRVISARLVTKKESEDYENR